MTNAPGTSQVMQNAIYSLLRFGHQSGWWLGQRFTPSGFALIGGIIISVLIGLDTNQNLAYQVLTFLVAILSLGLVVSQRFQLRFRVSRSLPQLGTVGLPLRYKISIYNLTPRAQQGLLISEDIANPYPSVSAFRQLATQFYRYRRSQVQAGTGVFYPRWFRYVAQQRFATARVTELPCLLPHQQTEVLIELTPLRRGVLQLQGVTVACPDPLGLVKACRSVALPESILILPQLYQLPSLNLRDSRRYQLGGVALSSSIGNAVEFRSLRDYRPEDSPRKIHWKSWAKVGKPIVKEEEDEYFVRHALILDTFVDVIDPTHPIHERLEAAISVASSLVCEVQTQESLLDAIFVGLDFHCFTLGRGLGASQRLLEILATLTPCTEQPFESLMPVVLERVSLISACICIFLTWDSARQSLMQRLEQHQIPTLVLLIGDENSSPPDPQPAGNFHLLKLGQIQEGLLAL